jgi:hypothetical protein
MDETYEISVVCRNCGHIPMGKEVEYEDESTFRGPDPEEFPIPKGIEVKDFLREMTCENCGCEGYMGLLNQPG